jgi:hypothetical protein
MNHSEIKGSRSRSQLRWGNFRLKATKRVLVAHFLLGKKTSIRPASDHPPRDSSIQIKEQLYKNNFPN